jgi:hypothetical protein
MRGAGRVAFAAVALTAAACGTVLGLNDYGNAPGDASADGPRASAEASSGDGAVGGPDSTEPDGPAAAPEGEAEASPEPDDATADGAVEAEGDDEAFETGDAADAQEAAPDADASLSDGGVDASYVPPPGWTLVAFASTPQTTCPTGFSGSPLAVVFDTATATPQTGACTCSSCSLTVPPSCVTGAITGSYDTNGAGTCTVVSQALANATPGGCNTDEPKSAIGAVDFLWNPPAPSGGSCTSGAPTADPTRVFFANRGRVCVADGDGGAPAPAGPFVECIETAGVSACPAGPFAVSHEVGTGATITCGATCTCAATATCNSPTITYYRSGTCSGGTFVMAANAACTSGYGGNVVYDSYKYTATVASPTCTATGTSTATVTGLASAETLCCAQ